MFPLLASRRGRAKIFEQALTTPGRLNEEDGFFEMVSHHMSKLKLRAELMLVTVDGEPQTEGTLKEGLTLSLIPNPNVVTHSPSAVGALEMSEFGRISGI